ncbi:uncharacterized protein LOC126979986 [Leptidea sinapis]|uniref:uncharacterized protein LOC126979986 n=1 Tax=Leptidea sinapis TaxID=189913 RepID=UPI0021371813|nr:uncharacterized protein LOC126979986 [Leptidea sinapis]
MFRSNKSLTEMMPLPEDDEWSFKLASTAETNVDPEASSHDSDIYTRLTAKNSRLIQNYTTFESNRIQWNKIMNFQEPTLRMFCPNLTALRDTFRSVITLRLVYSLSFTAKPAKSDKKSSQMLKPPSEQRVVLATIRCALKHPDWSQPSQHFHWDDNLATDDAVHWGDGDLSVLQYSVGPVKTTKGKNDADLSSSKQTPPENLTCHFGFGIDTVRG